MKLTIVVRTAIAGFADGLFPVFNRFDRAAADTGHAVNAVIPPLGALFFQHNIVLHAALYTASAANAGFGRTKSPAFDDKASEKHVDHA